jgi:hypothetical protein
MTWLDAPKSEHEVRREHYVTGRQDERERIIALLEARRYDLSSCLKDDDCAIRADAIDVCISDIKGENE